MVATVIEDQKRIPCRGLTGLRRLLCAALLPLFVVVSGCETPQGGGGPVDVPSGGSGSRPAAKPGTRPGTTDPGDSGSAKQSPRNPTQKPSGRTGSGSRERQPSGIDDTPDPGAADTPQPRGAGQVGERSGATPSGRTSSGRSGRDRPGLGAGADGLPQPRRQEGTHASWAIVLGTFTGPEHAEAAEQARVRLAERIPEFAGASVRSTGRGSTILWGQFSGPDDPAAQTELKRIQAYEWQGARPFARAFLTRPETTRKPPTNPMDLRNLRAQFPQADPLHTLQVAVWADFDGSLPLEVIRRNAESFAAQLRTQGFQAWFHHDDDLKMSVVTIGAFGADAYDPRSTLYLPEIEALMKKFPAMLVNGEPLMVRTSPQLKKSPEVPQKSMLVLVPPR